jgi:hypothetical protein
MIETNKNQNAALERQPEGWLYQSAVGAEDLSPAFQGWVG